MTNQIAIICPFYRQPRMLEKQLDAWANYPREVLNTYRFVVVDDCSPEPAEPIVKVWSAQGRLRVELLRIDQDIPWNRGMARNLGVKQNEDADFILHVDTDHVLPPDQAQLLARKFAHATTGGSAWYRFKRFRIGAADETRKKDKIDPKANFGEIHPHIDSYLCTPKAYWAAGGYNTRFSGVLGGGSPFLKEMERVNGEPAVLPIALHVHTRHSIPDSSENTLDRDPKHFKRRKQEIMAKYGTLRADPKEALPLPWHRIL
jgi:glycosyltransferase involved in cell wall biosynthesis